MLSLSQQFSQTAQKFAKRTALKYKQGDAYVGISFAQLEQRIIAFAKALQQQGIRPEDKVAIFSENRPEWVIADLATLRLGAISVPVHTTLSSRLVAHVLNDSSARAVVVSNQDLWNKLVPIGGDLPELRTIIPIDVTKTDGLPSQKTIVNFGKMITAGRELKEELTDASQLDGVASIVYTSGTTGMPQGVSLTHRNFMFDVAGSLEAVPVYETDVFLSFLPLSHVLERMAGYYSPLIYGGSTIAYAQSFQTLGKNMIEVKPTILVSVPRVFEKIYDGMWAKVNAGSPLKRKLFVATLRATPGTLKHKILSILVIKKIQRKMGGRLRLSISGGASLNAKLAKFFEKVGLLIIEGYGLTETSPVITVNRPTDYKFGTVGKPLRDIELKLTDTKEIITRGAHVMRGYYKNDSATTAMIDDDGWLHTGDMGFIDSDGFLSITGRIKEMIVTAGGKNVWPESIELAINNDRLVAQSITIGNNKKFIAALIIPYWPGVIDMAKQWGLSQDPRQLVKEPKVQAEFQRRLDRVNKDLADWEKVKAFRLLIDEFSQDKEELTPTLKLRRAVIAQHFQKEIDKLYQS